MMRFNVDRFGCQIIVRNWGSQMSINTQLDFNDSKVKTSQKFVSQKPYFMISSAAQVGLKFVLRVFGKLNNTKTNSNYELTLMLRQTRGKL